MSSLSSIRFLYRSSQDTLWLLFHHEPSNSQILLKFERREGFLVIEISYRQWVDPYRGRNSALRDLEHTLGRSHLALTL